VVEDLVTVWHFLFSLLFRVNRCVEKQLVRLPLNG
jgi:hypothetical protein